jgi:hypothetical protein
LWAAPGRSKIIEADRSPHFDRTLNMNLRRTTILLVAALALYAAGMGAAFIFCKDNWTAIQTWAMVLTGIVIIWYTWETMQLREAAFSQRELQLRPFVVFELKDNAFVVTNVGPGAAVNVRISEVTVDEELEIVIRFSKNISILRSSETLAIEGESFRSGKSAGDFFLAHLDIKYANREFDVKIEFQNVEMKPYSVLERVMPGDLRIRGIT